MPDDIPFFHVSLNLPHAGRVARRIILHLPTGGGNGHGPAALARETAAELLELLTPLLELGDTPPDPVAVSTRDRAALLGRRLVDHIEASGLGHDRLGQCVRNLFECLELGREGAIISLRAGEDPNSFQRPI